MRITLALAGMLAAATFAHAQSTTVETTTTTGGRGFYIVQDGSTKRCTVTRERPSGTSMTIVGSDGTVYKTETEARSALKTIKVCVTN